MHRPRPSAPSLPGRSPSESSLPLLSSRESERREHGGLLGHPSSRLRRAGPCAFALGTLLGVVCACLVLAMLALHRGGASGAVASPQLGDSSPAAAAAAAVLQLGARAASFAEERRGGPAAGGDKRHQRRAPARRAPPTPRTLTANVPFSAGAEAMVGRREEGGEWGGDGL